MAYTFFVASVLLTLGFAGVRTLEERRGERYMRSLRTSFDGAVISLWQRVVALQLLELLKLIATRIYRKLEHDLALLALSVVRTLERRLAKIVSAIRGKRRMERKEASEALKQTSEDIPPKA